MTAADLSDRERALQDAADLATPHIDHAIHLLVEVRRALDRRGTGTASAAIQFVREALDDAAKHLPVIQPI